MTMIMMIVMLDMEVSVLLEVMEKCDESGGLRNNSYVMGTSRNTR